MPYEPFSLGVGVVFNLLTGGGGGEGREGVCGEIGGGYMRETGTICQIVVLTQKWCIFFGAVFWG